MLAPGFGEAPRQRQVDVPAVAVERGQPVLGQLASTIEETLVLAAIGPSASAGSVHA